MSRVFFRQWFRFNVTLFSVFVCHLYIHDAIQFFSNVSFAVGYCNMHWNQLKFFKSFFSHFSLSLFTLGRIWYWRRTFDAENSKYLLQRKVKAQDHFNNHLITSRRVFLTASLAAGVDLPWEWDPSPSPPFVSQGSSPTWARPPDPNGPESSKTIAMLARWPRSTDWNKKKIC